MRSLTLSGCNTRPFGGYLKALAVLRLVSEQADPEARAWWRQDSLTLGTKLSQDELLEFFLHSYSPTPIVAPWNGGSGFYEKDRKIGIDAIANCTDHRFTEYRTSIERVREWDEVKSSKTEKSEEESRRVAVLRKCRNHLPDRAVEWLDASIGIAADGARSFAPVLGTGGNEGRLDYTNNFMERLATLLISPDAKEHGRELLENALFSTPTGWFRAWSAGQYDPGRAGGANQGQGVESSSPTNPWDFILTMEGAVAWASGLYRRQGVSYGSFLCSPFTVRASAVGYGSATASDKDKARAEIWAPVWTKPACYAEIKVLLREGRASVAGAPARNGIQFAEAATSLGIDRGISRFQRYSLLKRRGDSYVALPAGEFPAGYRSESDRVRQFAEVLGHLDREDLPPGCESLRRSVDSAIYEVLLRSGSERIRAMLASFGRLICRFATTGRSVRVHTGLAAGPWLEACGWSCPEVRIAAAISSIFDRKVGPIRENLSSASKVFAWTGSSLPDRLVSVLSRRLQIAISMESDRNPFGGACPLHAGDATLFIERAVDDSMIEDLIFAFTCLDWSNFAQPPSERGEVLPVYAVLKYLFLPGKLEVNTEWTRLRSDPRIISQLLAGRVGDAAGLAFQRLRVAGLRPLDVSYQGGPDPKRLAAALLIPVRTGRDFSSLILHSPKEEATYKQGN